jgi:hypothetical protein
MISSQSRRISDFRCARCARCNRVSSFRLIICWSRALNLWFGRSPFGAIQACRLSHRSQYPPERHSCRPRWKSWGSPCTFTHRGDSNGRWQRSARYRGRGAPPPPLARPRAQCSFAACRGSLRLRVAHGPRCRPRRWTRTTPHGCKLPWTLRPPARCCSCTRPPWQRPPARRRGIPPTSACDYQRAWAAGGGEGRGHVTRRTGGCTGLPRHTTVAIHTRR